jgi:AraC-like DNA-binding protein
VSEGPDQPVSEAGIRKNSNLIVYDDPLQIAQDHDARPLGKKEFARIWRHSALSGVELFHGSYRNHAFARHYHAVSAIGVVDRGVMGSYCRRANHVAPAGTVILFNPGDVHAPGPANDGGWGFRTFFLEEALFQKRSLEFGAKPFRFVKPFVQDRRLADRLFRLHRKLEENGTSLEFESSLLDILAQLAQRHVCVSTSAHSAEDEPTKVRRASEYIDAYYWQDVTLEKLSEVSGLSTYHLLRCFRHVVGLTPHAYLIQMRIEAAKALLRSGAALTTVAASTGFADQSHFSRHFRRIVGGTPGQYYPDLRKRSGRSCRPPL